MAATRSFGFLGSEGFFKDWLERNYPLKAAHIMARIHDMRGGRDNDPRFAAA